MAKMCQSNREYLHPLGRFAGGTTHRGIRILKARTSIMHSDRIRVNDFLQDCSERPFGVRAIHQRDAIGFMVRRGYARGSQHEQEGLRSTSIRHAWPVLPTVGLRRGDRAAPNKTDCFILKLRSWCLEASFCLMSSAWSAAARWRVPFPARDGVLRWRSAPASRRAIMQSRMKCVAFARSPRRAAPECPGRRQITRRGGRTLWAGLYISRVATVLLRLGWHPMKASLILDTDQPRILTNPGY